MRIKQIRLSDLNVSLNNHKNVLYNMALKHRDLRALFVILISFLTLKFNFLLFVMFFLHYYYVKWNR